MINFAIDAKISTKRSKIYRMTSKCTNSRKQKCKHENGMKLSMVLEIKPFYEL